MKLSLRSRIIISALAIYGILAAPTPAIADAQSASAIHRANNFHSSFEPKDPQPQWLSAVETAPDGHKLASGVTGASADGANPSGHRTMATVIGGGPDKSYTAKPHVGFSGLKALEYAGRQPSSGRGYANNKVFKVDIPVTPATTLSYKIFPALMNPDLGNGLPSPSTYVAVDLAFSDGTYLSDLGAKDQYGFALNARAQGASRILYANQWNAVSAKIGRIAAGKTIKRILIDYDHPNGPAVFKGWIDDIAIVAHTVKAHHSHLSDWVITTRGTNSSSAFSRGNTIPATALPHGFNFWTPVTDAGSLSWIYKYQQENNAENLPTLQAFSVSHEPSTWIGDRDTFQVMPAAGAGQPDPDRRARALAFTHANEIAKPYYYRVRFQNGLRTEVAPTDHAAIFRFTFTGDTSNLIFDNVNNNGGIKLDPANRAIAGYSDVGSGSSGTTRMFFYATFDKPIAAGGMLPKSGRPNVTGYYQFDTGTNKVVTMRIATSLISVAQAKHNLALEIPSGTTFAAVKAKAQRRWDRVLGVITDVRGATPQQLTTLYSNLYRLNLYPNAAYENTGTKAHPVYKHASPTAPAARKATSTHTGAEIASGTMYVNNGFWDTYRTEWPADSLLYPRQTGRMINGFVNQYKEGGWIARWSAPGYTNSMVGTSSDVAFADAYLKGVTNFDVQAAYSAALKNASVAPPNPSVGRQGLNRSIFLGYTPISTPAGLSWAMEGDINDFGIANMSKALYARSSPSDPRHDQYKENAKYFLNRAQNYVNLFDPTVRFFQGKTAEGAWRLSPQDYDPRVWGYDYTETDGWGMAFSVPQDGQGLANLYGGRQQLADKLDTFFSTPETARFPGSYGGIIHEMREAATIPMGQWGFSDQPAHHIPYMYDYAGEPYKTQAKVREALARLFTGSEIGQGYPGDEDNGEMSAWYIFSAMGFYPLQVGSPYYVIGSPLFKSATINLANGKKIIIHAPNNSPRNVYVQSLKVNGRAYAKTYLPHKLLTKGAVLDFDMGSRPSKWGARPSAAPLSIAKSDKVPRPLRDLTGPNRGTATTSGGKSAAALFDNTSDSRVTFKSKTPTVTWTFAGKNRRTATDYTLTSANRPDDPTSWQLEGSQDGRHWTVIDKRMHQTFRWRLYTRAFAIKRPGAYREYRLKVTANSGEPTTSLAEIELLGRSSEINR
jgi:predicted alpha-1,2-mannosidase